MNLSMLFTERFKSRIEKLLELRYQNRYLNSLLKLGYAVDVEKINVEKAKINEKYNSLKYWFMRKLK